MLTLVKISFFIHKDSTDPLTIQYVKLFLKNNLHWDEADEVPSQVAFK